MSPVRTIGLNDRDRRGVSRMRFRFVKSDAYRLVQKKDEMARIRITYLRIDQYSYLLSFAVNADFRSRSTRESHLTLSPAKNPRLVRSRRGAKRDEIFDGETLFEIFLRFSFHNARREGSTIAVIDNHYSPDKGVDVHLEMHGDIRVTIATIA